MFGIDDLEKLLTGVLEGLKARKEIEPIRKNFSTLQTECDELHKLNEDLTEKVETLTSERDDFKQQLNEAQETFNQREKNLRGDFNRQLAEAERNLEDAKKDFRQQLDTAQGELKAANKNLRDAQKTAEYYRDNYNELDEAYKIYLTLDDSTRFDLKGIFGAGDTVTGFFSGAVQESHLASFWDYVSRHTDAENLIRLFDFCFDAVNRGFREAPYVRLTVNAGDYFDSDEMRRTSQSSQMGKVVRVILQGYRYSDGNVIKKSVVELA